MEPFEIMISESQERMLAVVDPREARRRAGGLRALADGRGGDRRGHRDTGRIRVHAPATRSVADVPVSALVDDCPLYDLEPEQPSEWLYGNRGLARSAAPSRTTILPAPARLAQHRLEALGVRAVRLDRPVANGPAPGDGRRGGAEARGDRRRDRGRDRRQRASRRLRSLPRDGRGGARVRPEPRLRRRRAPRTDQLPQLRQSGEAPRRLAARPLGAGARGRLRGARGAGRRRQRVALQRDRGGADLSHPGRRHGRRASRPRAAPPGSRSARATRSPWWGRSPPRWPAPSWRSCAATSGPGCPASRSRRSARRSSWCARRCAPAP